MQLSSILKTTSFRSVVLKVAAFASLAVALGLAWAPPARSQVMKFSDEKAWWDQHFSQFPEPNYRGSGWRPYQRWVWFYGQRVDPATGYVPEGARWNAYLDQQRIAHQNGSPTTNVWTNLGPTNIAGRATPIAIDPSNHNRILLGTASGGLWESLNAGASWEPVDDNLPTLAVNAILFDANNPSTIYIGTGEGNFSADAVFGVGVLQSTDGGSTWNIFGSGLNWGIGDGKCVEKLVQNPNDGTIIAATTAGVYVLQGTTWTQTLAGTITGLLYRPDGGTTWYCCIGRTSGGSTNGIYKSTDDGLTWTMLGGGLPTSGFGRLDISLCTSQPNYMYTGMAAPGGQTFGIYKTTDAGATWTLISTANHYAQQGWYDLVIAVDPTNPNIVYSAGLDIYASTNGGTTFNKVSAWNAPVGSSGYVHADHHGWCFHPDDHNHVYDANDGGIFQSFNGGSTWGEITTGMQTMQFYDVDVAQTNPAVAAGGAQDNGSNVTLGSTTWNRALGGDGFHANIDYQKPDTMYMEIYYGDHYRTYNAGVTMTHINSGIGEQGAWDTPVLIDKSNTAIVYTAHRKIYKSTNRGASWVAKSAALPGIGTELAQSITNPSVLYSVFAAHSLFTSTDQGETWTQCTASGLPGGRQATRVAVDPTNPAIVYMTFSSFNTNNLWKSTDSGSTFASISGNLPALPIPSIAVDPENSQIIYAGTDLGVWRTDDGGTTWNPYGTGLPNGVVGDLKIQEAQRLLYAGMYGRGLWSTPLTGGSASVQEGTTPGRDVSIVGLFPNPLGSGRATVRFTLPQAGRVKVQLFDASGRLIEAPLDQEMAAGTHRLEWTSGAPNGVYFVRVRQAQRISTGKLVIQR